MKERGITLIALIITIVVILILVAVTISITLGDNGIVKKAQEARTGYTEAEGKETSELTGAGVEGKINSLVEGGSAKISTKIQNSNILVFGDIDAVCSSQTYIDLVDSDPTADLSAYLDIEPRTVYDVNGENASYAEVNTVAAMLELAATNEDNISEYADDFIAVILNGNNVIMYLDGMCATGTFTTDNQRLDFNFDMGTLYAFMTSDHSAIYLPMN